MFEFLSAWNASLNGAANCMYGEQPAARTMDPGPFTPELFAEFGERIIPQFGLYQTQASYPIDLFAKWIRDNRLAHETHGLRHMMPWVTTGFDGVTSARDVLTQAVHMLVSGATGFAVFAMAADGDWDSWGNMLSFSRAVELILPYEDFVALGTVAFDAVLQGQATSNVRAVSAMSYQGKYLIALTAVDEAAAMHVTVNASSTTGFELRDVVRNESSSLPAGKRAAFEVRQHSSPGGFALVVLAPKVPR